MSEAEALEFVERLRKRRHAREGEHGSSSGMVESERARQVDIELAVVDKKLMVSQ